MNSSGALPSPGYERTIGSPGLVVLTALGLVVSLIVVLLVAATISRHHVGSVAPARATELSFTHGPRERTSIARDWIAQDAAVREHLESYGWNDRGAGVARIPIERAMELVSRDAAADAPRKESP